MVWILALCLVQGWHAGAPMPTPGYGFACAEMEGKVYCIGGLTDGRDSLSPRQANEAYNVQADSWITWLTPTPQPCWFAGCAALNGRIYVIGGTDGRRELRRVMRYDPQADTWDTVASLPIPLQALSACTFNGAIHAAGGFSVSGGRPYYARRAYRFVPDSGAGRWVEIDSMRSPRASFATAVLAGRLFATGGKYFSSTPSVEYYVPNRWEQWPRQMPEPRSGHASVAAGDYLAVIGGLAMQGPTSSVFLLDARTGQWTQELPLPTSCTYLGAALVGTRVVAIGGRTMRGATGNVQIADSLLIPEGVAEPEGSSALPHSGLPSIVRASEALQLPGSATLLDLAGQVVLKAVGSTRFFLAPGVYFVRVESGHTLHKLTVIR
jgi:N-acetylneuraminic acid mutarotase